MNILFKEFFVFTDSGLCLYSWKSTKISESTDSTLIGGLLFAVSEFTKQAFRGRLQRLDLDNSKLIMTAQEFTTTNPEKDSSIKNTQLIFGALVDSRDDTNLIKDILKTIGNEIISHYDNSGLKPMDKEKIDPIINNLLKNKTYSRKNYYVALGLIISVFGLLSGSILDSFKWQIFVSQSSSDLYGIVTVMIASFGIIILGSMLIGEKNKAIKLVVLTNTISSFFVFYLFDIFISKLNNFSDLGNFYTYLIFVILISFTSSLFGSLITEKRFLFPEGEAIS